ncbi:hypothetical protein [Streptomyces mirabilis]|uniref:hypothetical protein n=1 Tax=Streptomyces mirabilis TaxID=68239 RepID=UPI00332C0670
MSAEAANEVVDAFSVLVDHCLACHDCRASPDQTCPAAQLLYRDWKAVWKKSLRRDLRKV